MAVARGEIACCWMSAVIASEATRSRERRALMIPGLLRRGVETRASLDAAWLLAMSMPADTRRALEVQTEGRQVKGGKTVRGVRIDRRGDLFRRDNQSHVARR